MNAEIAGSITTHEGEEIENVEVAVRGLTSQSTSTNVTGLYRFSGLPTGGSYTVSPAKNVDHLNGISTFDIVILRSIYWVLKTLIIHMHSLQLM